MKKIVALVLWGLLLAGVSAVPAESNAKEEACVTVEATHEPEAAETGEQMPEEEAELYGFGGEVTEVGEGYFLMQNEEMGEIQVNTGDETLFEGMAQEELAAGQFLYVCYDGKMTRSLPPQVFALQVSLYAVTGEVTALEEGSMTLRRDEIGDDVVIWLPENAPELAVGDHVTAYTNGMMTMSLPAQMLAMKVIVE